MARSRARQEELERERRVVSEVAEEYGIDSYTLWRDYLRPEGDGPIGSERKAAALRVVRRRLEREAGGGR